MNELRAAALKGAKFDYDREVEGVRTLDRYTLRIKLAEPGTALSSSTWPTTRSWAQLRAKSTRCTTTSR